MKEMTIKEVQTVSLDILKDVHNFCEQHNIRYTLQGGTLIGAIRHKGFIPWDDDIDIAMPRPEFERFIKEYRSPLGYKVIARDCGDQSVDIMFARVCDMKQTYVKSPVPWSKHSTGIWIDVFPLDGIEDNRDIAKKRLDRMKKQWNLTFLQRSIKKPFNEVSGFVNKIKYILKYPILLKGDIIGRLNEECKRIPFGSTNHYCNISFLQYGIRECHRNEVLKNRIKVPFEDAEFYIMEGYDEALTEKYGDYMKLPSVDQQVAKHDFEKFYWK